MTLAVLETALDELGAQMTSRRRGLATTVRLRHPLVPTVTATEWTLDDAVRAALRELEGELARYAAARPPGAWS